MKNSNGTDTYPLAFAADGETVSLTAIHACDTLRARLGHLGLNVGMRVRVVNGGATGPMILAVANDSRLALGRNIAHKIMVTPAEKD
jgi:Fe2+ transport system protein FeoA